ncbi:hypothetical protein BJX66DRAFT_162755 [Aspergillus keveii]|uniref:Uncharacterized protein n=1 Tax=Aspergillus keveii TaxID=714993 RepID=A0ABR4G9M5_9EURO
MLYADGSVGLVHMPRAIQRLQAPRISPGLNATASLTRSRHRRFLHACEDDVNASAATKSVAPSSQLLDSKIKCIMGYRGARDEEVRVLLFLQTSETSKGKCGCWERGTGPGSDCEVVMTPSCPSHLSRFLWLVNFVNGGLGIAANRSRSVYLCL